MKIQEESTFEKDNKAIPLQFRYSMKTRLKKVKESSNRINPSGEQQPRKTESGKKEEK